MRIASRWILILPLLLVAATVWGAPTPAETRALAVAEDSFRLGFWERAEKQFASFAEKFPKSDDRAQAILRQAQARLKQGKFSSAADLLIARQRDAGKLADEFLFWFAEANFQNTNYPAAAEAYARLTRDFTNSAHLVEAAYDQALARAKLGDWPGVQNLLQQPDGALQKSAANNPTNEFVTRAVLLLGEAQLAQNDFHAAEETIAPLASQKLGAELDWRRQYLLCRIQFAADRAGDALVGVTNLLALAKNSGQRELQAESALLEGGILERLKRFDEAVAAYQANLTDDLPVERRRQALLKIVELQLARNKTAAAVSQLEKFLGPYAKDKAADTALLAVGELHLKQFLAAPNTNDWQQALAQFDGLVKNFPRSPVVGKALLDRGWCFWLSNQIPDARSAFQSAAERAALAEDQALARYKWADCQLQLNDVSGALANYQFVVDKFSSWPGVRDELFEPALYQTVRAALLKNDLAAATNALGKIIAWYPAGFLCERSLLLTGEKLNRTGNPARAREIFSDALKKFSKTDLSPEVQLAVARTYEREQNWPAAAGEYERWLASYSGQESQSRAEFSRAWDLAQAGQLTNALTLFTNFVAHFPTNDLAPLAQNWAADFYLQSGDYKSAEAGYQLLFQKWPLSPVTYPARLMAGRAAMARQGYAEAGGYFTKLINDLSCPPELVAQAYFEYGDATMQMESTETNSPLANFKEAIVIFSKIPQLYPTNDLVPLAWGRIGDCYLQRAAADAQFYAAATNAYAQVIQSSRANATARSKAEVGMGVVLEKLAASKTGAEQTALLKLAIDRYLNVALGANLHEAEQADPFWVKKSALEAARLAEASGDWPQAINLYQRLENLLPSLKDSLEKKIQRAREQMVKAKV